MNFVNSVILVCVIFHHANLSRANFLKNKIIPPTIDVVTTKIFFDEFKIILEKHDLWHLAITGASEDKMGLTKLLLEYFPSILTINSESEETFTPKWFGPSNAIICFLGSVSSDYVAKVMSNLFSLSRTRIFLIFGGHVDIYSIEVVLREMFVKNKRLAVFVHHDKDSVKLYSYQLFDNCSIGLGIITDWEPGRDLTKLDEYENHLLDFLGCPLPIGTGNSPPWMYLEEDDNAGVKINGGTEGNLILAIADKMNFTPLVQSFDNSKPGENHDREAILTRCVFGDIGIGINQIRPTERVVADVDMSTTYGQEYLVWYVPRITEWRHSIIAAEFSWKIWVLIGLTFLLYSTITGVFGNSFPVNRGGERNEQDCSRILLESVGTTLGSTIIRCPASKAAQTLLIIYICYTMVITTAYKTSLASMLTVDNGDLAIVDVAGILKANLTIKGHDFGLRILDDQIEENDLMPAVIKRFVVDNDAPRALRQVEIDKNQVYLTTFSYLAYHRKIDAKHHTAVSYDVLDDHVLTYSTVMIFQKGSPITARVSMIVQRLMETGILDHWKRNNSIWDRIDPGSASYSVTPNTIGELQRSTREKFRQMFFLYHIPVIICALVWAGELLVYKYRCHQAGRTRRS